MPTVLPFLRSSLPPDKPLSYAQGDANFLALASLSGGMPCAVAFGPDGSITETFSGGQVVVTTFPTTTTMLRTFSGLITGTIHTTFNPDGSITEV